MTDDDRLQTTRIRGITGTWRTTEDGAQLAFGLNLETTPGGRAETIFSMRYELLAPFVTNLINLGQTADQQRSRNPIYATTTGAFAYGFDGVSVAPTVTLPGLHLLTMHLTSSQGKAKYAVKVDRDGLQSLRDTIDRYLRDTPTPPSSH